MFWSKLWPWSRKPEPVISVVPKVKGAGLKSALWKVRQPVAPKFPIQAPTHARGVLPEGVKSPVGLAMDGWGDSFPGAQAYSFGAYGDVAGFPGYPYLSMLATRAEYRAMATALSTELTREWIKINSTETASNATKTKVTELTKAIEEMRLQQIIQRAAEHDAYFGRAQIFIDIQGHNRALPLVVKPQTIKKGSTVRVCTVEAIWTTPAGYNAIDPVAPEFYRPAKWFMLGQQVDASRLMTVITRPLPDMLKPAFDFGGMSLSQIAEPYVNNWLRTRQSVADLVNNFSITALKTTMGQTLSGDDDGTDLFDRADLFTATRSNRGVMLLDMTSEDLVKVDTSLAGLDKLQAQAQEHMCAVSRLPAIILTGISPTGLNASSEGEIKVFYDWIAAVQEAFWWGPIDTVIQILQLSLYGEIDPDITWEFVSLYQMTPKELAEIRTANATTATGYITAGVIDPDEERERLARDPESGYQGLDLNREITPPDAGEDDGDDNEDDK